MNGGGIKNKRLYKFFNRFYVNFRFPFGSFNWTNRSKKERPKNAFNCFGCSAWRTKNIFLEFLFLWNSDSTRKIWRNTVRSLDLFLMLKWCSFKNFILNINIFAVLFTFSHSLCFYTTRLSDQFSLNTFQKCPPNFCKRTQLKQSLLIRRLSSWLIAVYFRWEHVQSTVTHKPSNYYFIVVDANSASNWPWGFWDDRKAQRVGPSTKKKLREKLLAARQTLLSLSAFRPRLFNAQTAFPEHAKAHVPNSVPQKISTLEVYGISRWPASSVLSPSDQISTEFFKTKVVNRFLLI